MRAVILAAGLGRRMMPLTADNHKALLKIAERPVLARIVDALAANNITDLTIVSGYHAAKLQDFMQEHYPQHKVQWIHNDKYETTNNIYSLALALEQIANEDIILIECDLVFDPSIISVLLANPHEATALVSKYESGMDGTVVSLSNDVITAIHPPHLQGEDFSFSNKFKTLNIYKFSRRFLDQSLRQLTSFYAKSVTDNCYYELVLGVMIYMQSSQVHASIVDTSLWAEIDDPVDVLVTEFKFNPAQRLSTLQSTHGAYWNYPIEDFCYVHNAYFPTEGMISMLRHDLPLLLKSFGSSQVNLERKLSYFLECDQNKIVSLNGASQIFPWLREQFADKKILIPKPTFGEYIRNFPQAAQYEDMVGVDCNQLNGMLPAADVIVFVNPNNPTGSVLKTTYLEELIGKHPDKVFLIDESFIDFSDQPSIITYLQKHPDCRNVLVLKSLGKTLGVPGLRTGFLYSNDELLLDKVRRWLPIWNMNSLAEYFLELLLKNRKNLVEFFALVKMARLALETNLRKIPFIEEVFPSQANFLLARVQPGLCPPEGLAQNLLQKNNIYVKDVSSWFPSKSQYFRFAVRKAEQNEVLVRALSELSLPAKTIA